MVFQVLNNVAILNDNFEVSRTLADWGSLPPSVRVTVFTDFMRNHDALVERLAPFDALILMRERTPFPRELIERLPNLRLLVTGGMANRAIDVEAATQCRVLVTGTQSAGNAAGELAWGLLLACARHIPREDKAMRDGAWQTAGLGIGLQGKTLGLLGLGKLGARMVPVARAFGMDVIAWSPNLTAARAAESGARLVAKDQLLSEADFISIHLVLGERTRGLIGAAAFARMKPTAVLINTSRGPIVDEDALIAALESGAIAGAGLDVYEVEPLPADHRLRYAPNTVITPHLGYVCEDNYRRVYTQALEDIQAYLAGKPIRVLNPELLARIAPPAIGI